MGAIAGRIILASDRDVTWFWLVDPDYDVEVRCHADTTLMGRAQSVAKQLVVVEGWLRRDGINGKPLLVNPVVTITVLPDIEPGSHRMARGVAPRANGDLLPEEAIRRVRDADARTDRSIAGIRKAAGAWDDIDAEEFKAYIRERRRTANRPSVDS